MSNMADRFPSLEDFDTSESNGATALDLDPTAATDEDFITRERAALGDDASFFASANDKTALVQDDDEDLLGGEHSGGQEHQFMQAFPAIDSHSNASNGGTITGPSFPSSYTAPSNEPEPEVIRQWRERRDLMLQERAEKSDAKQAETVKASRQNIDDFYKIYNTKKEKQITQTRGEAQEFLKNREDTSAGGTSWERIAKLVDLSGKGNKGGASGTGKERFREMLMGLRKDEKAPGASGY